MHPEHAVHTTGVPSAAVASCVLYVDVPVQTVHYPHSAPRWSTVCAAGSETRRDRSDKVSLVPPTLARQFG
jgi:hypothetical protein